MNALCLNKHGGPGDLVLGQIPDPSLVPGQVLVKVHATALTPTEFGWFPTFNTPDGKPRPFPIVPSHEFSGVVAGLGENAAGIKMGDAVYGMNDWFANGAEAELCAAPADALAPKPASVGDAHAAVVPISALTAWQGLFDRGQWKAGQTVLVHGGAGAVGLFAVQLAHWRGARVIATASAGKMSFVRELGADEVIDYRGERFEDRVRDADLVFDTVGGETLERSWAVVRPGGRLVTIATESASSANERARDAFLLVKPNRRQLAEIAQLIDAGKLRPLVEAVYPLARSVDAYKHAERGGAKGKVVLQVNRTGHRHL
jgi:NADPH:quinone reductase-like Zn-dependent oxidoreductase